MTDGGRGGEFVIRRDCRYYRGDRPCRPGKVCAGCGDFAAAGPRALVVKLAAAGDVLRTTPLLRALKAGDPPYRVTWVTDAEAVPLLRNNPLIDELVPFGFEGLLPVLAGGFDWMAVLDKEPRAAALGRLVEATAKYGFTLDAAGRLTVLNPGSAYALRLGLDDDLKFRGNRLTYPRLVYDMCGFTYTGEEYVFSPDERARLAGLEVLRRGGWRPGAATVGLNTGCGDVFATKKWTEEGFVSLAGRLAGLGLQVVIMGGPDERERNGRIKAGLAVPVVDAGVDNPLDVFAGIIDVCDLLVTADTLALHLAVALRKEVVLLMGPTAPAEIDLFGRGEIVTAGLDCSPCYRPACPEGAACMYAVTAHAVFEAVQRRLPVPGAGCR